MTWTHEQYMRILQDFNVKHTLMKIEAKIANRTIAVIPARGGSKRIPRKNVEDFLGKPVVAYPIATALESKLFAEVMVSTDDEEIAEIAKRYHASVPFMRSAATSDDHATTADVLLEVFQEYEKIDKTFDYCCCIYPVTPLLRASTFKESFELLERSGADALMPVIRYSHPIQRALQVDDNGYVSYVTSEFQPMRTQDLPPRFHDAGQFYLFKVETFLQSKQIVMDNTVAFEMPESSVQDIDTEEDWKMAELKYAYMLANPSSR